MNASKLIFLFCVLEFSATVFSSAYSQEKAQPDFVSILRQTGPYNPDEKQTYPDFTYQSSSDPHLVELRTAFNLDSVAGTGSQVDRAIRLMHWMHDAVPHDDNKPLKELNALNIITTYKKSKYAQACYGLSISLNEIFLSMGFKSRVVICFSHNYEHTNGGHVITALFIDSLNKWIYTDAQENAYVKDEKGNLLSIEEVRQRLIDGRPMILNPAANYHNIPSTKKEYLYTFMAEHIYRFICPLNSEYNSQTREPGKIMQYVELLPVNSGEPPIDKFESQDKNDFHVVSYHTNNDLLFWKKP